MDNSLFEIVRNYTDSPMLSKPVPTKFKAHFHQNVELLYTTEGESYVTVNGKSVVLTADQIAISDSYDIHSYDGGKNHKSISLIIPSKYLHEYTAAKGNYVLSQNFIYDTDVAKEFKAAIDLLDKYLFDESSRMIVEGLFSVILGLILKHIPLSEKSSKITLPFTAEILTFIEKNLTEDLSLERISGHFHYSKCYFSNIFKERFGKSYTEYVNIKRSHYAINLMKYNNRTPTEASIESGFGSVPSFYRFFKKYYGVSPIEYIKNL